MMMKSKYWFYGIIALAIVGVIFISGCVQQPKPETVTCNPPYIKVGTSCCLDQNSNNVCDNDEQPTQQQIQQEKKISSNDLIKFVQETIQENFPQSRGTFVKSQDINDAKEKGHGCFTGFSYPCTSYLYPYDDAFGGEVYSHIYDFGEGDSPSLSRILSDQSTFPGVGKRSLKNGDIVVQEYDIPNKNSYTGEVTDYSRLFEADVPCSGRYWVKIGFFQQDNDFSGEIEEKGAMLSFANEVLGYCNG